MRMLKWSSLANLPVVAAVVFGVMVNVTVAPCRRVARANCEGSMIQRSNGQLGVRRVVWCVTVAPTMFGGVSIRPPQRHVLQFVLLVTGMPLVPDPGDGQVTTVPGVPLASSARPLPP